MKQTILLELLRNIKTRPKLMRKFKILAMVGAVGVVVTGALVIWAGVFAFNFVATRATELIQSPQTSAHVENLRAQANELPKLQALNCWGKAQSLMAFEPWLQRPALDNLNNLKVACLESEPAVCEGKECAQMNQLRNTHEGRTI